MTDGQSVSQSWCRASSGAHDEIFITVRQSRTFLCGASFLTRGWVCPLPESQSAVISLLSVCTIYILHFIKDTYIHHIQGLCQSRLSTADYALFLVASSTRVF
jgi:hypothetical protein